MEDGFAFWMLGDLMGREHNFAGLQRFIADHQNNPGHAVVHDFEVHMRRYAPDPAAYDQFAKQWLDSVVVPEYRLTAAKSVKTADGWETSVHVENAGTGRMPVEVAVLAGERVLDPTEKQKAPYQAATTTIVLGGKESNDVTIRSSFKPDRVVTDPDARVLQLAGRGGAPALTAWLRSGTGAIFPACRTRHHSRRWPSDGPEPKLRNGRIFSPT